MSFIRWSTRCSDGDRQHRRATINQIGDFIGEGERISATYMMSKDANVFHTQYGEWSAKVTKYLAQVLDRAYAAQFQSAQPIVSTPVGMNMDVAGTWQKLQGQSIVLGQILTELRRRG